MGADAAAGFRRAGAAPLDAWSAGLRGRLCPGGAPPARIACRAASRDAGLDIVLCASQTGEAPKIDEVPKWDTFAAPSFTMPFNVTGYPAITVCAGFGAGGLPVAIQLVGKPFAEATVFRVADAFEKATPFRDRRPALIAA